MREICNILDFADEGKNWCALAVELKCDDDYSFIMHNTWSLLSNFKDTLTTNSFINHCINIGQTDVILVLRKNGYCY